MNNIKGNETVTVFDLQLAAIISMICDHIGAEFIDKSILRVIGRFGYAMYALLLAEGFRHYKDDPELCKKHFYNFIMLAIISEFCYDFLFAADFSFKALMKEQNCVITLLLGFVGLLAIDKWKNNYLYTCPIMLLTALCSYWASSNYRFAGVLLIYAFYYYLNNHLQENYWKKFAVLLGIMAVYLVIYHWSRYNFCGWDVFVAKLHGTNRKWYITHIFVTAALATYSGKLGYYSKTFKVIYKWFYPAHLFLFGVVKHFLIR